MPNFTIVHVSDLHLSGRFDGATDTLLAGIKAALQDTPQPHILVVSGDLVDSPRPLALNEASAFLTTVESIFDHRFLVPGNHDVKRFVGTFARSNRSNALCSSSPELYVPDIGLHLSGLDSTASPTAHGKISKRDLEKLVRRYYASIQGDEGRREQIARLLVVHHHPLPLADAEANRYLGHMPEEDFVYLREPALLLKACISCNIHLVLHGHRHVRGMARYSIPSSHRVKHQSADPDATIWKTIYVLSCPSSTGHGGQAAGFNVLQYDMEAGNVLVGRYERPHNHGTFELVDTHQPHGTIRIPLAPEHRSPAQEFFSQDYASNSSQFKRDYAAAQQLWVMGMSQNRMIIAYGQLLSDLLDRGGKARFILSDPNGAALEMCAKRASTKLDINRDREVHLEAIERLASLSKDHEGQMEVKTVDLLLPFTIYGFDIENSESASFYVWMTTLFLASAERPGFVLSKSSDRYSFDTFVKQFNLTWGWEEATTVDLDSIRKKLGLNREARS